MLSLLYLVLGGVLLTFGADYLVSGAASFAKRAGISSLVIGLTIVSYGTSVPELAVSVKAAIDGTADIALGNVVGSNICNVLLILGLASLFSSLSVHRQLIRKEVPIMIGVSAIAWFMAEDLVFSRFESLLLLLGVFGYSIGAIWEGRREGVGTENQNVAVFTTTKSLVMVVSGIALLVGGARLFVDGAVDIARYIGISELVIGLTVVAIGTSMPEIVTSVVAAKRGNGDIAIGNVVGSNIFNILSVLGAAGLVSPIHVAPAALHVDMPIMLITAIACYPIFLRDEVTWLEGFFFLANYAVYLTYLVLAGTNHPLFAEFSIFALDFVLPLSGAILIAALVWHTVRRRKTTYS